MGQRKKRGRYGPKKDLTGQRFGFLEVLRMEPDLKNGRREYRAVCKCHNCGKEEHSMYPYHFKYGGIIACGCLQGYRVKGKERKNYTGYELITGGMWDKIRRGARRRELDFSITAKEGWDLYLKQDKKCALTGLPIRFNESGKKFDTASLDRIDSLKGYTKDNIQWVHRNINIMKYCCTQDYFVNMCRRVVNNENLKQIRILSDEELLSNELFVSQSKIPLIKRK